MGFINRLRRSRLLHGVPSRVFLFNYDDAPSIQFEASSRLPTLPIEIWRRIFELVCRLPGTLCFDLPDPFLSGTPVVLDNSDEAKNLRDKCSMQLVCRAWRVICLEFVFESLVVCCRQHAGRLATTLENSKTRDMNERGHGWWTKQIESKRGLCSNAADTEEDIDGIVLRILRCTPNLAIYINNNGWGKALGKYTHPSVMNALGKHCGAKLRRLEWAASESPRWDDLEVLLFETPQLRTLSVLHVILNPTTHVQRKPLFLRQLRTLSLGPFPTPAGVKIPTWEPVLRSFLRSPTSNNLQLPSLTYFSLTPISVICPASLTERFFTIYGPLLRCLRTSDLTPRDIMDNSYFTVDLTNPSLQTMLSLSPQLTSLVFNPLQPIAYPSSHPALARIAIYPPSEHPVRVPPRLYAQQVQQPLDTLFAQLASGDFPGLRILRLRDISAFAFFARATDWLEKWCAEWAAKGVRFENRDGLSYSITIDLMEMMPDI